MADDSWEYGAGEEIEQKIMDDYESPDFDISEVAGGYDSGNVSVSSDKGGNSDDSFINPDEKLKDWDFDGLQVEKHSKGSRRKRKKKELEAAEAKAAAAEKIGEAAPGPDDDKAAGKARKAEEEKETGEAWESGEEKAAEDARKAEEEKAAEEARIVEETKRAEAEQQAAFERISKTVKAPIASSIIGDTPDANEVSGEEFHVAENGEESHGD